MSNNIIDYDFQMSHFYNPKEVIFNPTLMIDHAKNEYLKELNERHKQSINPITGITMLSLSLLLFYLMK